MRSLKKKQKEIVKKHHQELGLPDATAEEKSPKDVATDEDSDLASLARELAPKEDDENEFCPLDSPFIKKVHPLQITHARTYWVLHLQSNHLFGIFIVKFATKL